MEPNCIICMYDEGYEIAGPFNSLDALSAWGQWWQAENGDRPTWQSVYLADPARKPKIVAGEPTGKNQGAVELGRRGGMKGGVARAANMTPEARTESARLAAAARWSKRGA